MKISLCCKLSQELELAMDEDGDPIDAFMCFEIDVKKGPIPGGNYDYLVEGFRKTLANQYGIGIEYIVPIMLDEYIDETQG